MKPEVAPSTYPETETQSLALVPAVNHKKLAQRSYMVLILTVSAIVVWFTSSAAPFIEQITSVLIIATVMLAAASIQRQSRDFARSSGFARMVYRIRAVMLGSVGLIALGALVPFFEITLQQVLIISAVVFCTGIYWALVGRWLHIYEQQQRVLFVGHSLETERLLHEIKDDPHYFAIGIVSPNPPLSAAPYLGPDLEPNLGYADHVVISATQDRLMIFEQLAAWPGKITVQELSNFCEDALGRAPVYDINAAWFMRLIHPRQKHYSALIKRGFDIVCALLIGILTLPLIPFIILGIKFTSKGPLLYKQTRCGQYNQPFTILKFRTMQIADDERAQWASAQEARITRVGRWLRLTRMDELPQLINILKGQMSFVGPRPEQIDFVNQLEMSIPHYSWRHMIKPGLTGWAQVRMGYADSVDASAHKLGYDLYYLKHHSLFMDLIIITETIRTVLLRENAK